MEVDSQRNPEEPFLLNVKKAFDQAGAKERPGIVYVGSEWISVKF